MYIELLKVQSPFGSRYNKDYGILWPVLTPFRPHLQPHQDSSVSEGVLPPMHLCVRDPVHDPTKRLMHPCKRLKGRDYHVYIRSFSSANML